VKIINKEWHAKSASKIAALERAMKKIKRQTEKNKEGLC